MTKQQIDVETFMRGHDHPLKDAINDLRHAILDSNADISEQIKWNAPSFRHVGEDRVTFNLRRPDAFHLIFHRGATAKTLNGFTFDDPHRFLTWAAPDRAIATIRSCEEARLRQADIVETVNRWIVACREAETSTNPA